MVDYSVLCLFSFSDRKRIRTPARTSPQTQALNAAGRHYVDMDRFNVSESSDMIGSSI